MSSPTFESLRLTLHSIRRRRSRLHIVQQTSIYLTCLLALLFSLSLLDAWLEPSRNGAIFLFVLLIGGSAALLWRYVQVLGRRHSDDRQLAHYVEEKIPDLEQRLLTSLEFTGEELASGRKGVSHQFIKQLWSDAEEHVHQQREQVEHLESSRAPWIALSVAAASFVLVGALFLSSDALLRGAAQLLWPFEPDPVAVVPEVNEPVEPLEIVISLEPGDISMQRGEQATIVARVMNAAPADLQLRMQTDNVNWQNATMRQDGSGSDSASYSYVLPSVREDTIYYVSFTQGGEQRSQQFRISVYDLPRVEQIDVAYTYPPYTGWENDSDEDGGDMVVPEGTTVELQVSFNKNVSTAVIEFQNETGAYENAPLTLNGSTGTAQFTVTADTAYRIHAVDFDRLESRDAQDYYIRAIEDQPPVLVLRSPGRDQDVMPLEEVVLEVEATDDYGLTRFALNYSVVGADEVAVDFLPEEQTREIIGNELIYLEDLNVSPGDFVSYYLTLADNNGLSGPAEVISDIYFLQVIPTDQEFRRVNAGQGQGQQGGARGDSSELVTVQKDIIAATWKLRQQANIGSDSFAEDVQVIAEAQLEATLRAQLSIDRLSERLSFSDASYDNAVRNLQQAIEQMHLAVAELNLQQVNSALKPEQSALQFILRAEADINRTNVTQQQAQGGGGGGGAQQEREDLRELFDMEMGQRENRYETPQNAAGGAQNNSEEANKLEELARRQEGLTRAQRNLSRRMDDMTEEQRRRELERLRREQEQLSEEVSQLAQQISRSQQSQQAGQQQSPQQGQQQGQQGQQGGQQQAGADAQSQLQRAAEQMQQAAEAETPAMAAARSQRALESLREQQRTMNQQQGSSVNQLAQNVIERGQQLIQDQRELQRQVQDASREQGLGQTRLEARDTQELRDLAAAQQEQRRELEEIERMLRAIIARGDNEDQRLLAQAQQASRSIRPIREQMDTSNRILSNGMVNLAADIEREISTELSALGRQLQALNPGRDATVGDPVMQAARDAAELREQVEELQRQALALANGQQDNTGESTATVADMRQRLARSQQLAQGLTEQLQQQQAQQQQQGQQGQPGQQGQQQAQTGQPGQQGQQGQGQGQQQGQQGQQGQGQQQAQSGQPGGGQPGEQQGSAGGIPQPGGPVGLGNARSISLELTRQSIEDFLNQPELLTALLQPVIELEGQLRAQAELEQINRKLYSAADENVPDQYRQLVQEYYRVLSDGQSPATAQ